MKKQTKKLVLSSILEIPKNSFNKYEYDLKTQKLKLDRVLYGTNVYPCDYGFIPNTLDYDGDPLDILIISTFSIFPGCYIDVRVVGVLEMIDNGEIDSKLIGVVDSDPRFNHINDIEDVNQHFLKEIKDFFLNYKNLQSNSNVEVKSILNASSANKLYNECLDLNKKLNDFCKKNNLDVFDKKNIKKFLKDIK